MAKDVTINITANTSSAVNDLNNTIGGGNTPLPTPPGGSTGQNNPPTQPQNSPVNTGGNSPAIPAYDRMAQDIRREMLSRGALMVPGSSNFNQLMAAVQQQQRTAAYQQIDDRYTQGVTQTQQELENKRKTELDRLEQERQDKLSKAVTPNAAQRINNQYDRRIERLHDSIEIEKATAFTQIGQERDNDKVKIDQDLARIASELVQELRRGNPNSYLGRLREQYKEATWRRDNAETEEEAQAAGAEASVIQRRMQRAMMPSNRLQQALGIFGGLNQVVGIANRGLDAWRQNTLSEIGEVNSAANGDAFGAMQQDLERRRMNAGAWGGGIGTVVGGVVGGVLAALGSWGIGTAGGAGAGAVAGGALGTGVGNLIFNWSNAAEEREIKLGQMWQQQEQRLQQFNELALVTRGRTGNDLATERQNWLNLLRGGNIGPTTSGAVNFNDLGYTGAQFSNIMAQRAKQRGFYGDNDLYTINGEGRYTAVGLAEYTANQIALERAYNMSEGSLSQYSIYDRYNSAGGHKNDANQDMANLVASLSARGVKGMSGGQTLRANEFLNYQTQLMEMQKGWMDAPNANYATRLLLAAQNAFGNNFDSRAITEIGQVENTVTHPKEDYSKALLYDVIQDVIPQTKGNLLAIRQAQYSDDPNVRMRIQQAMAKRIQEVYGGIDTTSGYLAASHYYGIEDPERLRKIIGQYERGLPQVTEGNVEQTAATLKNYTPEVSKQMLSYQDETTHKISESLDGLQDIGSRLLRSFEEKLNELINEIRND